MLEFKRLDTNTTLKTKRPKRAFWPPLQNTDIHGGLAMLCIEALMPFSSVIPLAIDNHDSPYTPIQGPAGLCIWSHQLYLTITVGDSWRSTIYTYIYSGQQTNHQKCKGNMTEKHCRCHQHHHFWRIPFLNKHHFGIVDSDINRQLTNIRQSLRTHVKSQTSRKCKGSFNVWFVPTIKPPVQHLNCMFAGLTLLLL